MPVQRCQVGGKKGWKWGASGKCYVGTSAKSKAATQGRAIKANDKRCDKNDGAIMQIDYKRKSLNKKKINTQKKQTVMLPPVPIQRQYNRALQKYLNQVGQAIREVVIQGLPSLVSERDLTLPPEARADGWVENSERMIDTLNLRIEAIPFDGKLLAMDIGQKTNKWHNSQWQKVLRGVFGVNIYQQEPWIVDSLNSFTAENATLITKMTRDEIEVIEGHVQRGLRAGSRHTAIAKDIQKTHDVTRSRAKLIARDQVQKLNNDLTRLRQTEMGVEEYIWRTSKDERVRPTHKANDGKRFKWNSPPSDTGHPGHDVQCRCTAEAVFDEIFEDINGRF